MILADKQLKPGQLFTLNNHVYKVLKQYLVGTYSGCAFRENNSKCLKAPDCEEKIFKLVK